MSNNREKLEQDDNISPLRMRKPSIASQRQARDVAEPDHQALAQRRRSKANLALTDAMRRMTVFRRLSIIPSNRRGSAAGYTDLSSILSHSSLLSHSRAPEKVENTYQLAPFEGQKFNVDKVEKIIFDILESYLDGEVYEERKCNLLAKNLSDVIKSRIKEMDFPRYKIVCLVTIGQLAEESLQFASRCVWNPETDNFACGSYRNASLFCTAVVYGVYLE